MEEEWRGGRLRQKDAGSEKLNWFGRPLWISSWKVTCIPILNSRLRRLHSLFNLFRLASIFDSNASLASNSIPPIVFNIHLLRMACWLSSVCDDRQEPEQVALRWEGSGPCSSQRYWLVTISGYDRGLHAVNLTESMGGISTDGESRVGSLRSVLVHCCFKAV